MGGAGLRVRAEPESPGRPQATVAQASGADSLRKRSLFSMWLRHGAPPSHLLLAPARQRAHVGGWGWG